MALTRVHYDRINHFLPEQRGNVVIDHFTFLRALQYMTENGCRWRASDCSSFIARGSADDPEGQKLMEQVPKKIYCGKPLIMRCFQEN